MGEPFDVKAFEAYSLPAGKNADSLYLLAQRSLVKLDHKRAAFARSEAAEKSARQAALLGWGEANDDVRKWLDANEKALGAWKSGTMWAEAIEVPLRELNFESDLPVSNDARTFVKLALAKASQLTHEEQTAEAWTWYRATLRASRHLGMRGGVVERMVGADVYRLARDPILNWAACTQVSAADLRQALDDIVAIDSMTAPLSRSLKVEYLGVRHSINLVLTNLRKEHPFVAVAIRQSGRPEQMMRVANLYFANWLANADRPRSQRRPRIDKEVGLFEPAPGSPRLPPPRVLKKLIAMQLSGLEPNMGVIKSPIVDYALPGMMFLFDTVDQDQVNRAAVITGLALQLYLRDHGRFPQAVSELVSARYLKILPRDPYGNGESIHYRLESKPPERAVVWSVGLGGISEAGELPAAKGDDRSTSDTVFEITAARQSPLSTK
ncbi:MAG TPA: hypothetical protein VFG04_14360 [Planctomycetaceae bacterium]|nr:hypothetical protein [Planctomycetaceae bacterium]